MLSPLKITLVQSYLYWENIEKNLDQIHIKLTQLREKTDLIVLPEMFSTGFSLNVEQLAEQEEGRTMRWMKHCAEEFSCVVTGSLIIKEDDKYYNRLIWMRPDGTYEKYDKKHLFGLGDEHTKFTAGDKKLLVELNGWRIQPVICYDLRFPIWLRNTAKSPYDLMLVVANWPEARELHWRTLIPARAIENQAFVAGVNRVGFDAKQVHHSGDSMLIDPLGTVMYYKRDEEDVYTTTLVPETLTKARRAYPFLKDADKFAIK